MEIRIECTDGQVSHFTVDDGYAIELIESIRPSELFRQPLLLLQSGMKTSIFNMNQVECVYFVTPLVAELREQPPARELHAISAKEYLTDLALLRRRHERESPVFAPGALVETLLALHCASGKSHYLSASIVAGHRMEQTMDMRGRLERLTAMIRWGHEGYVAINPHSIKEIEMYPSPPLSGELGWVADSDGWGVGRLLQLEREALCHSPA